MAQARSWRCSICDIDWPLGDLYKACKKCGGETWQNDDKAITWEQARALQMQIEQHATNEAQRRDAFEKANEEFERYYADRAVKEFRAELEAL